MKVATWVMGTRRRPILIAGPTASGKSALALRVAERLGGVVINADAMQCYRDLRIITARPDPMDEARAPHALYGTIDAANAHSVERWLRDMRGALDAAEAQSLIAIVVGGTGLYFKALTQGLSAIPEVPAEVRAAVREWAADKAPSHIHAELAAVDPAAAARLRPTDPQRLVRALEVVRAFGTSLTAYQAVRGRPLIPRDASDAFVITTERQASWRRIDERFDRMMAQGALDEVEALRSRDLDRSLPLMRSLGVPQLFAHLGGTTSLQEAVAQAKLASRRYVKRQDTFARTQLDFRPITIEGAEELILQTPQLA